MAGQKRKIYSAELQQKLLHGEYATSKTKVRGKYIKPIICSQCGKPEAWAYADKPFRVFCPRLNKCGVTVETKHLFNFPEIEESFPATKDDPNQPARRYLETRGLSESTINRLESEYWPKTRKGCGGGIMFPVGKDDEGNTLYNGRLFNPPPGEGKTHNRGSVSGHHWKMPGMKYDPEKPTYVVEGIIDAASLIDMGFQAIAVLGAGYNPESFDLSEFKKPIFAFDNDQAGAAATKKWLGSYKDQSSASKISAIMPLEGDWNDLLCSAPSPEKAAERFDEDFEKFTLQAKLRLAEDPRSYANLFKELHGHIPGLFPFNGCYFWSCIKESNEGGDLVVNRVSNFTVKVLHYQLDDSNSELPTFYYRLEVRPKKGRTVCVTCRGDDLKAPAGLSGFFLSHAKVVWKGNQSAAYAFAEMVTSTQAPIARQATYVGYDHQSRWYVFRDFAVNLKGEKILPDGNGFFKVQRDEYLRPALTETLKPAESCEPRKVIKLIYQAWGEVGLVAVAFLTASIFANQIKKTTKFFPFLSLHGDPQSGKSQLMRILNAMQCLDEEGIPMSGANTKKGELRSLAQVSGMLRGLIEGNDPAKVKFDFESILPLYNHGNPLQVRAQTTNDNRTHSTPFYGALAFVQNVEPFRSRAAKERVISLKFSTDDLDETTKAAFTELMALSPSYLAGFLPEVIKHRESFGKSWRNEFEQAKKDLREDIPDNRINENHALVLAFYRLLCQVLGLDYDLQPFLSEIGGEKMISCQQRILTPADHFFQALDNLPDHITGLKDDDRHLSDKEVFCHEKDGRLYVQRPNAEKAIRAAGFTIDFPERLGSYLQQHPAFLEGNVPHRFPGADSVKKSYVFELGKLFD